MRLRLYFDQLGQLPMPFPPKVEQTAIANFLDAETSKIDALVAEQRRLIELLKEKRQAVISHAVTKGLNPNAPMKDSGIEWLGDVPEHWTLTRIKHLADGFMYGTSSDCNQEDEGTPVLRIPNIKDGYVDFTDLKYANFSTEDEDRYILSENDILVVRTNGNPQLVGKSAIFTSQCKCIFASYLIKIQPRPNVVPAYLNLVMNASCTREMLTLSARTSAGNYNMNCEGLGRTYVILPPLTEQREILTYLEARVRTFDQLQAEAEKAIELLQERCTALISAAVTGKIDVRGYAAQETA